MLRELIISLGKLFCRLAGCTGERGDKLKAAAQLFDAATVPRNMFCRFAMPLATDGHADGQRGKAQADGREGIGERNQPARATPADMKPANELPSEPTAAEHFGRRLRVASRGAGRSLLLSSPALPPC